jgi:hypothetical protein
MGSLENGMLSRRSLNFLIVIFFVVLGVILITSDRGVSGAMERIGAFVTGIFGQ